MNTKNLRNGPILTAIQGSFILCSTAKKNSQLSLDCPKIIIDLEKINTKSTNDKFMKKKWLKKLLIILLKKMMSSNILFIYKMDNASFPSDHSCMIIQCSTHSITQQNYYC